MNKATCVIMNLANHESLVAASLTTKTLRDIPENELDVTLIDIRDVIPDVDQYIWIGCGKQEDVEDYLHGQLPKEEFKRIIANSAFLNRDAETREKAVYKDGLVYQAREAIKALTEDSRMMRWCITAMNFYGNNLAPDEVAQYYRLLWACHEQYMYGTQPDSSILEWSPMAGDQTLAEFQVQMKDLNRALSNRTRDCSLGDSGVVQLNTLGKDVYVLLRRLSLGKKDFIHTSMGAYGVIVHTNHPRPLKEFKELSILKIEE